MKWLQVFLSVIFLADGPVYWENIPEEKQNVVVNDPATPSEVQAFYLGKFTLGDNTRSHSLLKTISDLPKDENRRALYFFLFNRICSSADGALAELIGRQCLQVVSHDPGYLMDYFSDHPELMQCYARFLGYEFYFAGEGLSYIGYDYSTFKKRVTSKISNIPRYESILVRFFAEIDAVMKKMD